MNRIKKYIMTAVLVIVISLFAGCAELIIDASIDANNKLIYSYKIDVSDIDVDDANYMQVKGYFEKVQRHWESSGYETDIFPYDGGISLYMEIEEQHETRDAAFAALYNHMTNEISPFIDVDYGYNLNYYYEDYFVDASLDFTGLVDDDIYTVYPDIVGKDVDEFMEYITCTVNISLPQNQSTTTDIITNNSKSFDIPFNEETEISISGIINNNANKIYEQDLIAKRELEQKNMKIFFSVAAALLVILILLIIFRVRKKKKLAAHENDEYSLEQKAATPMKTAPGTLPREESSTDIEQN